VKRAAAALIGVLALCGVHFSASAPPEGTHGTLKLFFLGRQVGQEQYQLARDRGDLVLRSTFDYTERGFHILAAGTLRTRDDFAPIHFDVKGKTYHYFGVDASVDVHGTRAAVMDRGRSAEADVPERVFAIDGYAPLSMQMMLLRYWLAHGKPHTLATLPAGAEEPLEIEWRGRDTIAAGGGASVALDRYSINGLAWGRESVWLTPAGEIAAAMSFSGGLPLEAVADRFATSFDRFVSAARADRLAEAARVVDAVRPVHAGTYAISGATLVDGTGRAAVPDALVIVSDGRITQAGPRSRIQVPRGVAVVDARGQTLLPGLWDMHAHAAQVEWGPTYLAAGVTTARDCGGELEFTRAFHDAIASGRALGPRLFRAGLVDGGGAKAFGLVTADTPEEGRAAVHRYHDAGFEQMKIYTLIEPGVLQAIAQEAHRLGMTVTGHVPQGMTALEGVSAGMDQVNHLGPVVSAMTVDGSLDLASPHVAEVIEFLKAHHTVVDPTVAWGELTSRPLDADFSAFEPGMAKAPYALRSMFFSAGTPPDRVAALRMRQQRSLGVVRALHAAGIPIVAGTDKGLPGHTLHREIELYVEAGLTPMQAIQAATLVPARVMHADGDLGTIEAGKRADMILLGGNPLADIHNIRRVSFVISGGRMYPTAPLWQAGGFKP
jgi:imidazolonepropionase-like amidohydrolase